MYTTHTHVILHSNYTYVLDGRHHFPWYHLQCTNFASGTTAYPLVEHHVTPHYYSEISVVGLDEVTEDSYRDEGEQPNTQVLQYHLTQQQALVNMVQQSGGWWVYNCQCQLQHSNSTHMTVLCRRDLSTHYSINEGPQQYAEFRGQQAEEAWNAVSKDNSSTGTHCS